MEGAVGPPGGVCEVDFDQSTESRLVGEDCPGFNRLRGSSWLAGGQLLW